MADVRASIDLALEPAAAFDVLVEELTIALARSRIRFEPGPGGHEIGREAGRERL